MGTELQFDPLLDALCTALKKSIIPNVEDAYAKGQAVALYTILKRLPQVADWRPDRWHAVDRELASLMAHTAAVAAAGGLHTLAEQLLRSLGAATNEAGGAGWHSALLTGLSEAMAWIWGQPLPEDAPVGDCLRSLRRAVRLVIDAERSLFGKSGI